VNAPELALFAAETVYAAGIPIIEITMTVPGALEVISDVAHRYPDMAVGAGTVLDEDLARRCIEAGARFLTSPGFVPEVVAYARKANVVVFPGALTPTEVIAAWKAGSDFVKIFPTAPIGGVQYIRALKVPLPQIPLIATGGVNQLTALIYCRRCDCDRNWCGAPSARGSASSPGNRIRELARRFLGMVKEGRETWEMYH